VSYFYYSYTRNNVGCKTDYRFGFNGQGTQLF